MMVINEMIGEKTGRRLFLLRGDPLRGGLVWVRDKWVGGNQFAAAARAALADPNTWAAVGASWSQGHPFLTSLWVPSPAGGAYEMDWRDRNYQAQNVRLLGNFPHVSGQNFSSNDILKMTITHQGSRAAIRGAAREVAVAWASRNERGVPQLIPQETALRVVDAFSRSLGELSERRDYFSRLEVAGRPGDELTGYYQLRFDERWSVVVASGRLWAPTLSLRGVLEDLNSSVSAYQTLRGDGPYPPRAIATLTPRKVALVAEMFCDGRSHHTATRDSAAEMHARFLENYPESPRQAWLWGLPAGERNYQISGAVRSWLKDFISPAQLAWNGGTVLSLATGIYQDRRWDDLPILADALEDAGSENANLLYSCRDGNPEAAQAVVLAASAYKAS